MDKDIKLRIEDYSFNCRAVAIIMIEDKILLQKRVNDKYWALPGGKIQIGEESNKAIYRELKEELGIDNIINSKLINVMENFFQFGSEKVQQYIFTYRVYLDGYDKIINNDSFSGIEEDKDLMFRWFSVKDISSDMLKPDYVREQLLELDDIKPFGICIEK